VTINDIANIVVAAASVGSLLIGIRNKTQIDKVEIATNSMKDALILGAGREGMIAGHITGTAEGLAQGRAESTDSAIANAAATAAATVAHAAAEAAAVLVRAAAAAVGSPK
jgi:hypothetical protein